MHIRFSALARRLVFLGIIGALIGGSVGPVSADLPLPIIDIVPISTFSVTENAVAPNGGPNNPAPLNGNLQLDGTFTLPLFAKGLSASYDRVQQGALDSALAAVPVAGGLLYPGGSRDIVQTERLDYSKGPINFETGLAYRHRMCCPFNSAEWHKVYLGVSYTSPSLAILNHGVFVVNITGNDSPHYPNAAAVAALGNFNVNKSHILTTQQSVTAVIPIDRKSGVRTATTFVWGALDYFENQPFPAYYDVFVFSGTKQVTENFGVTANLTQVHQRLQGAPFPSPGGVETSALNVFADIHLNFADFLKKPSTSGPVRPIQPGGAGAAGGPAPINKSQGGTTSPAPMMPGASPAPMMPGASPAPMMPGASPAPMMSGSPEPMMSASPAPMMSGAPASPTPAP